MGCPSGGGGEAQLSKDPALGFVSKVVVRYPVYILSYPHPKPPPSVSFMALHPRKGELQGAREEGAPSFLSVYAGGLGRLAACQGGPGNHPN